MTPVQQDGKDSGGAPLGTGPVHDRTMLDPIPETANDPPRSTPVTINPRPLAVAVTHDRDADDVSRVTATGTGVLAEHILRIAFAAGVKVRTDPDLANLLSLVEVGEEIPAEAFAAVAEVLAYVYRAGAEIPNPSSDASEVPA